MSWLIITILAYFFLAIVSLFDRYFLVGPMPHPIVYTFYIGILGGFLCLIFIPLGISLPEFSIFLLGLGAGLTRIFAILFLVKGIIESEVSRVVPAIGGFLPIFSLLLFLFYFPRTEILNPPQILAFLFLLVGSVLISLKKISFAFVSFRILKWPLFAAFLFALTFLTSKILFLKTNFLEGVFLILFGGAIGAISFLIFSGNRKLVFGQRLPQKISGLFLLGQLFGGLGMLSQYYAVFLAKAGQIPLINALEGTRFVFLLFFVFLLSLWRPELLKEEMKGTTLFQKIIAILLIGAGLVVLALK